MCDEAYLLVRRPNEPRAAVRVRVRATVTLTRKQFSTLRVEGLMMRQTHMMTVTTHVMSMTDIDSPRRQTLP